MKLYIPEISDEIRLIEDWTFDLYNEDRNSTLMEITKDPRQSSYDWKPDYGIIPCTIPAGAVLKVDRIYIRKGKGEYSSLSFLWKDMRTESKMEEIRGYRDNEPTGKFVKIPRKPVRFWAKLQDVNKIVFELV